MLTPDARPSLTEPSPFAEKWARSLAFWQVAASQSEPMAQSLKNLVSLNVVLENPGVIGNRPAEPNILAALAGEQDEAGMYVNSWFPQGPRYGAMPQFDQREAVVADFNAEAARLKFAATGDKQANKMGAEGILLFELKFGDKLSHFAEQILDQYPPRSNKTGKEISMFGLSGSGKSTVAEALQQHYGDDMIIMDSDTMRYNLLAKLVKDAEATAGRDVQAIKDKALIHNAISGALYVLVNYVSKTLIERGYLVVKSSSRPDSTADVKIYVEHPDGIDPSTVGDHEIKTVAETLFQRTQARVNDVDDYDWDNAETVLDFRRMKPVTVQVPRGVHEAFLKQRKKDLTDASIVRLPNPRNLDAAARSTALLQQLIPLIEAA